MKREIIVLTLVIVFSLLGSLLNNVTFVDYGAYLWVVPAASALLVISLETENRSVDDNCSNNCVNTSANVDSHFSS